MNAADDTARQALIQYLRTDQLFGLKEVPLRLPPEAPSTRRADREGRGAELTPTPPGPPRPSSTPGTPQPRRAAAHAQASAPASDKAERLGVLDEAKVKGCTKCGLVSTRTNTVFGQGNPHARLVFVGEAPGFDEDRQGLAFVGRAGQLLTRMIAAMGLTRDEVFICNVLKCRPPNNRDPATDEIAACSPYLYEQLGIIEPEVIIALGAPAAKTLLQTGDSIGRLRGRFHDFYLSGMEGVRPAIPLMPTYHPAYLLRNPGDKGKAWADLQAVMQRLGLPPPQ